MVTAMNLKIVACKTPRHGLSYSVRLQPDEEESESGFEEELGNFVHRDEAEHLVRVLSNLGHRPDAALRTVSALLQIHPTVMAIAMACDQQGMDAYATKAHMRQWGAQIFNLTVFALNSCGLEIKPDQVTVPRSGPAI